MSNAAGDGAQGDLRRHVAIGQPALEAFDPTLAMRTIRHFAGDGRALGLTTADDPTDQRRQGDEVLGLAR